MSNVQKVKYLETMIQLHHLALLFAFLCDYVLFPELPSLYHVIITKRYYTDVP